MGLHGAFDRTDFHSEEVYRPAGQDEGEQECADVRHVDAAAVRLGG